MCPKCSSKEVGEFVKRLNDVEGFLKTNKCHECDCVYYSFDFDQLEKLGIGVSS